MAGKYRVIVSEEAKMMLLAHMSFLSNVSVPASRKFLLAFKEAKAQLAAFPLSGPYEDDPALPAETYRKCLFYGRYHILYEVENRNVYIDAIVDCCQGNDLL